MKGRRVSVSQRWFCALVLAHMICVCVVKAAQATHSIARNISYKTNWAWTHYCHEAKWADLPELLKVTGNVALLLAQWPFCQVWISPFPAARTYNRWRLACVSRSWNEPRAFLWVTSPHIVSWGWALSWTYLHTLSLGHVQMPTPSSAWETTSEDERFFNLKKLSFHILMATI